MGILKHDHRPTHDRTTGHDDHGGRLNHDRHDMPFTRGTMLAIAIATALVIGAFQLPFATVVERGIASQDVDDLLTAKHTSSLFDDKHTFDLMINKKHTIARSASI